MKLSKHLKKGSGNPPHILNFHVAAKENNMTSEEAKQALKDGKKVRAVKWWSHEYVKMENLMVNDSGERVYGDIFEDLEDDDWEIVE